MAGRHLKSEAATGVCAFTFGTVLYGVYEEPDLRIGRSVLYLLWLLFAVVFIALVFHNLNQNKGLFLFFTTLVFVVMMLFAVEFSATLREGVMEYGPCFLPVVAGFMALLFHYIEHRLAMACHSIGNDSIRLLDRDPRAHNDVENAFVDQPPATNATENITTGHNGQPPPPYAPELPRMDTTASSSGHNNTALVIPTAAAPLTTDQGTASPDSGLPNSRLGALNSRSTTVISEMPHTRDPTPSNTIPQLPAEFPGSISHHAPGSASTPARPAS